MGNPANLTLFAVNKGKLTLRDSEGEERTATEYIEAKGAYVNGQLITG
jgi:dihydroorotase